MPFFCLGIHQFLIGALIYWEELIEIPPCPLKYEQEQSLGSWKKTPPEKNPEVGTFFFLMLCDCCGFHTLTYIFPRIRKKLAFSNLHHMPLDLQPSHIPNP